MDYILFLDDERTIEMVDRSQWPDMNILIARSSRRAQEIVRLYDMPKFMSLDHDLGIQDGFEDTTMVFLKWLFIDYPKRASLAWTSRVPLIIPEYVVHSANPIGTQNIISYIESYRRSLTIP
jgi:hypothetical protein